VNKASAANFAEEQALQENKSDQETVFITEDNIFFQCLNSLFAASSSLSKRLRH